jgi:bifunctional DNA-binding transcriptional regulator/antitoxin component of YhaV-PrlF toxin-antitoxin module
VTIPAQVRRAAGIEAGVPLVAYVEDGRVVIETREQLADRRVEAAREDHQ